MAKSAATTHPSSPTQANGSVAKGRSLWAEGFRRLLKNKASVVSAVFIFLVCLMAIFAEELAPYPYDLPHVDDALTPPNSKYWLGTDSLGRDMLSRIIYGAQMSMSVAIYTSIISLIIGGIYGAVSGWMGGVVDSVMMRVVDILYAIPTLVLLILVKVFFDAVNIFEDPEKKALVGILMALSVVGWVMLARVVRGQVLQVKQMTYVEASHALGAKGTWIVIKHIFPNILGPIVVLLSYQIPSNILFESFLSFIGLGLQPPYSSWGVLASDGWRSLRTFPHLILYPSIILFFVILAFNLFGDGLRDAFDPKTR